MSVGGRGHWVTAGRRGLRGTVGLPGTGVYYTTRLHPRSAAPAKASPTFGCLAYLVVLVIIYLLWPR